MDERAYCARMQWERTRQFDRPRVLRRHRRTHDSNGVSSFVSAKEVMNHSSSVGERSTARRKKRATCQYWWGKRLRRVAPVELRSRYDLPREFFLFLLMRDMFSPSKKSLEEPADENCGDVGSDGELQADRTRSALFISAFSSTSLNRRATHRNLEDDEESPGDEVDRSTT